MFDLHNHYTSLPNIDVKRDFRVKVQAILNITYNNFYMMLARNEIPPRFHEDFANKIMKNPSLKFKNTKK